MIEIELWLLVKEGFKTEPCFIIRNTLNKKESSVPFDDEEESAYSFTARALRAKPRRKHYAELRRLANEELHVFVNWKSFGQYQSTIRIEQ